MSFRAKVSTKSELITRKTEQDSLNSYIYEYTEIQKTNNVL